MLATVIVLLLSHQNEAAKFRELQRVKVTLPMHLYTTIFHWKQSLVHTLFPKYEKLISLERHVRLFIDEIPAMENTEKNTVGNNDNKHDKNATHAGESDETFIDEMITRGKFDPRDGVVVSLCLDLSELDTFGHYPSFGNSGKCYSLADIGIDALSRSLLHEFSVEERSQRVQLAACYRLFEMFGWTDTIYGHLTARSAPDHETFLINPFGLLYDEITASSLVRIDLKGNIDHAGIVPQFGINRAGYVIHSAIHEARQDINCVMHCHFADGTAVSCLRDGVAPISQTSHILGPITYHDYEGIAVSDEERLRLQRDLGTESKVLILKNHGIVTCGATIGEAFLLMFTLIEACKIQVRALSAAGGALDNGTSSALLRPSDDLVRLTQGIAQGFNKEGFGQRELSAYMRRLDRTDPSYRL